MDLNNFQFHIDAYKSQNQILDAAHFFVRSLGLEDDNLQGFDLRDDEKPDFIVVTTEGALGEKQTIKIPKNLFDFDLKLVANLIAHEMLHVRQKAKENLVEDKNEREFQAYYEMLYHKIFPQIPDAPDFNRKQFCEKALEYYERMGEKSELKNKYALQKSEVETLLDEILIKRGEKIANPTKDSTND